MLYEVPSTMYQVQCTMYQDSGSRIQVKIRIPTLYLVLGTLYNSLPYRRIPSKQPVAYHKLMRLVGKQVAFEHRPLVHVAEAKLA